MEVHIVTLSIQRWCLAYFRSFLLKIFLDLLIHGDYNEHVFSVTSIINQNGQLLLQLAILVLFVSMFLQAPATVHFFFNPFQFIFLFAMIFIIPPCLISAVSIFDSFFQEVIDFPQHFRLALLMNGLCMRRIVIAFSPLENCLLGTAIEPDGVFSPGNIEYFFSIRSHSQRIHRRLAFFDGIS